MQISRGRLTGKPSEARSDTFTGRVWADPVLSAVPDLTANAVFFEPGARTHWHRHGAGQVLVVEQGRGLVHSDVGTGGPLEPGDVVYIAAGERHWHGAAPDTYLLHLAISIGSVEWLDPVADADYEQAAARL